MDAKQYAWLYLVEHGVAGVSHSYYGGYEPLDELKTRFPKYNKFSSVDLNSARKAYLADIKKFGVDWVKTSVPQSDMVHQFAGTFAECANTKETIHGTLVLKNKSKQTWVADKVDIDNVFEMMAMADNAKKSFKVIFGAGK